MAKVVRTKNRAVVAASNCVEATLVSESWGRTVERDPMSFQFNFVL